MLIHGKGSSCRINWRRIQLWRIQFTGDKGNSVRNSLPSKYLRLPANLAADGKKKCMFLKKAIFRFSAVKITKVLQPILRGVHEIRAAVDNPEIPGPTKGPHGMTWDQPSYGCHLSPYHHDCPCLEGSQMGTMSRSLCISLEASMLLKSISHMVRNNLDLMACQIRCKRLERALRKAGEWAF